MSQSNLGKGGGKKGANKAPTGHVSQMVQKFGGGTLPKPPNQKSSDDLLRFSSKDPVPALQDQTRRKSPLSDSKNQKIGLLIMFLVFVAGATGIGVGVSSSRRENQPGTQPPTFGLDPTYAPTEFFATTLKPTKAPTARKPTKAPTARPSRAPTSRTTTTTLPPSSTDGYFNLVFLDPNTPAELRTVAQQAVDRLQKVIKGGPVGSYTYDKDDGDCYGVKLSKDVTTRGLVVLMDISNIDGVGGILGQAGPCIQTRNPDGTIFYRVGYTKLDAADITRLGPKAATVIAHEIMHMLGVGTHPKWNGNLVAEGARLLLQTPHAREGNVAVGGTGYPDVETDGGPGTARGHWDESGYREELMTGYLSGAFSPLSALTAKALEDMGFVVDMNAVDPFKKPSGRRLRGASDELYQDDLLPAEPVEHPTDQDVQAGAPKKPGKKKA